MKTPNLLYFLEPVGSSPPKIPKESKRNYFEVDVTEKIASLSCPGQSYPAPAFRYSTMELFNLIFFKFPSHVLNLDSNIQAPLEVAGVSKEIGSC